MNRVESVSQSDHLNKIWQKMNFLYSFLDEESEWEMVKELMEPAEFKHLDYFWHYFDLFYKLLCQAALELHKKVDVPHRGDYIATMKEKWQEIYTLISNETEWQAMEKIMTPYQMQFLEKAWKNVVKAADYFTNIKAISVEELKKRNSNIVEQAIDLIEKAEQKGLLKIPFALHEVEKVMVMPGNKARAVAAIKWSTLKKDNIEYSVATIYYPFEDFNISNGVKVLKRSKYKKVIYCAELDRGIKMPWHPKKDPALDAIIAEGYPDLISSTGGLAGGGMSIGDMSLIVNNFLSEDTEWIIDDLPPTELLVWKLTQNIAKLKKSTDEELSNDLRDYIKRMFFKLKEVIK